MTQMTTRTRLVPAAPTEQLVPAGAVVALADAATSQHVPFETLATADELHDRLGTEALGEAIGEAMRDYGDVPCFVPFLCLVRIGATPASVHALAHEALLAPDESGITMEVVPDDFDEERLWDA